MHLRRNLLQVGAVSRCLVAITPHQSHDTLMKRIVLVLGLFSVMFTTQVAAQQRLNRKHLEGTWKMVIDLKEAESEVEGEEDEAMARMILGAVDGLLSGVDIWVEFRDENRLKIIVDAYGDREEEWGTYHIEDGRLYLDGEDHFSSDDTVWMRHRGRLQAYETNEDGDLEKKDAIYMERLD